MKSLIKVIALTVLTVPAGVSNSDAQDALFVAPDGKVGISNSNPLGRLHVLGDVYTGMAEGNRNGYYDSKYRGITRVGMLSGNVSEGFAGMELETRTFNNGNGGIIRFRTWGSERVNTTPSMTINEKGHVGINVEVPRAALDVSSSVNIGGHLFAYFDLAGNRIRSGEMSTIESVSIIASGDIATDARFISYSDRRIKKDMLSSDAGSDLAVLNNLKVTNYRYIDAVSYGDQYIKGFIAQEVEQVFPQAVKRGADFIPDIFAAPATVFTENGRVVFTMKKLHQLKDSDIVKIYTKAGEEQKIVTVHTGNSFSIEGTGGQYREAFVLGKKVTDFRMVDYDRLFTLNVSATQELSREIEKLKAENEESKKAYKQLSDRVSHLETKDAAPAATASR